MSHLRTNRRGILVAVEDERVRGFVDVRWGESETNGFVEADEAYLKALYVDPAFWNEGIGTALLEHELELLPESIDGVRLETFAENTVAGRFYESKGVERDGTGVIELAGESYPTHNYAMTL